MELISNILIPTDFSPAAWNAIHYGLKLTVCHKARITLLHVYPSENKYMAWLKTNQLDNYPALEQLKEKMKSFTEELKLNFEGDLDYLVRDGNVINEIVKCYNDNNFDLMIMGVNSGSSHNQPGSHTTEIICNTGIPVLIIPGVKNNFVDKKNESIKYKAG